MNTQSTLSDVVASPALGSAIAPVLEQLEPRRLLSAAISGKTLNIVGTSKADTLTVSFASNKVTVRLNSTAPQSFAVSKIQGINIQTLAGNDTVNLPSNLPSATIFFMTTDGGDGNDLINGSNLNDNEIGGNGNDTLIGNAGDDTLMGQAGNDSLSGGAGNKDRIYPGLGNDICSGGVGNYDTLSYQDRSDGVTARIDGGNSGNLKSGERDTIATDFENAVGGNGNDLVVGNAGSNTVGGAKGNDTLDGGLGNDTIYGDEGTDTVTYASRTKPVFVFINSGKGNSGEAREGDMLITVENAIGGSGADSLVGDSHNNVLTGGAGNDTLVGNAGNDTLDGGVGKDNINGGVGADTAKRDTSDVVSGIETLK